ncbi:MAG: trehalose-6-phosphate synthase [Bacteroidota bacterium]|nr:trehalose-6-phosphate synthase [Bacteroidota bacterium]
MKINFAFIFSVLLAVGLVSLGFTFFEVSKERNRLKAELENRSSLISQEFNNLLPKGPDLKDQTYDTRISDSLSTKYNLLGVAIYYGQFQLVAMNSEVRPFLKETRDYVAQSISTGTPFGNFFTIAGRTVYQYIKPSVGDQYEKYAVIIYSDAEYISNITEKIFIGNFIRLFIQVLLLVIATTFLIRWGIFRPINKIVNWLRAVKDGKIETLDEKPPVKFLEPLHKEITNLAYAMQEARATAEEEAKLRSTGEAIWTPDRLKEEVKKILPDKMLIVVSNREPYMHVHQGKEIKCIVPASGMVTAVEPILKACGGLWIASGTGDADRETVDKQNKILVPPDEEKYTLKRIWVSKEEEDHFYYGFSNEGIWPLCHLAHTRPIFREEDWNYYKKVNSRFARAVLEEVTNIRNPYVLVQDYHFALLPEMIKKERPDAIVAIFWHIPWPNPEFFSICPWQSEILRGMLGSDLIGFHTQYHCHNFLETVNNSIDSRVIKENLSVKIGDQTTYVKSFPISIAFTLRDYDRKDENLQTSREILSKYNLEAQLMGIGVERIDYTKGIIERFLAIEKFFDKYPSYQGKFTFVQIGAPSRTEIKSYSDIIIRVEAEAARINARYRIKDWKPILLLMKHHSHEEIMPFYKAANLCMVTSLHDGMNLVAKEFVASRNNNDGVLILSRFAGASHELQGSIIVNPYNTVEMCDAIKAALEMPRKTQQKRMKQMRQVIVEHNIYSWAASLLRTMVSIQG